MVCGTEQESGTTRTPEDNGFKGTALVRLENRPVQTPLRQKIDEARERARKKQEAEKQKPWFQAAVIQYLGNGAWRLGLFPISGDKPQWLEGLPFSEILTRIEKLETRIKRVDYTSKEYRSFND